MRPRIDPITHIRSGSGGGGGGKGFGLPPPSKFRSGHLPTNAIPVRTIPVDGDESGSASDNDRTSDSEDGIYGGRYSPDSSPQDDRVPSASAAHRYSGNRSQGQAHYGSDYTYSDVSSSMDTVVGRHKPAAEKLVRGTGKYSVARNGYTEDESSDSAASSEFSTSQAGGGSINSGVPPNRAYVSEGYASSVASQKNLGSAAQKVCDFVFR